MIEKNTAEGTFFMKKAIEEIAEKKTDQSEGDIL